MPRRLVGGDSGSAGVGGTAPGRGGGLRDQRNGFAAVAVADRATGAHPLCPSAVAAALGSRWLRVDSAAAVAGGQSRTAAAPVRRVSRRDPWRNRFQPAGHPDGGVSAVGAHRRGLREGPSRPGRDRRGDHRVGQQHNVALVDLKAAVADEVMNGRGNPDGIHWNFEAHRAVAELMLKALGEAGKCGAR